MAGLTHRELADVAGAIVSEGDGYGVDRDLQNRATATVFRLHRETFGARMMNCGECQAVLGDLAYDINLAERADRLHAVNSRT